MDFGPAYFATKLGRVYVYPIIAKLVRERDAVVLEVRTKLYPHLPNCCVICGRDMDKQIYKLCDLCKAGN